MYIPLIFNKFLFFKVFRTFQSVKEGLVSRSWISLFVLLAFFLNILGQVPLIQAYEFHLPAPGVMVHLTQVRQLGAK